MTEVTTELNIKELVGEMPAKKCEVEQHGHNIYHADGGEQYVEVTTPCCGAIHMTMVWCQLYIESSKANDDVEWWHSCGKTFRYGDSYKVLGPVES